jgi:hypothetical protein
MGLLDRFKKKVARPATASSSVARSGRQGDGGTMDETAPLTELFTAVDEGTLPLDHACQRAAKLGAEHAVTPAAIEMLSEAAFRRIRVSWRQAWSLSRIVYAAADAGWLSGDPAQLHSGAMGGALVKAAADLVSAAHAGLMEAGDVRLFNAARVAADRGLEVADALGSAADKGVILQRRGSMILDCYTAGRTAANHEGEFRHWIDKALSTGDPELIRAASSPVDGAGAEPAQPWWPAPLAGMDLAEADLRAALPIVPPERRGPVLKALMQTLEWRAIFGGPTARAELVGLGQQALAALPPDDVQARLAVSVMMDRAADVSGGAPASGEATSAAAGDPEPDRLITALEHHWAEFAASTDATTAWDAVSQAAASLASRDPNRAMRVLALHRQLSSMWVQEEARSRHFSTELQLCAKATAPGALTKIWDSAEEFDAIAVDLLRTPDDGTGTVGGGLTGPQAAGALTLVMLASTKFSREAIGLQAASMIERLYPEVWAQHEQAYSSVVASMHQGEAVNLEQRGEPDAAVAMYLQAALQFMDLPSPDAVVSALQYAADLVGAGNLGDLSVVSAWCAAYALRAELLAPASGPAATQRLIALTLAHQARHGTSAEEAQMLMQAAKGRLFAATLAHGTAGWAPDAETRRLLADEARAEERLPCDRPLLEPPGWEEALDDDDLVTAYASEFEVSPSDTPEGAVVNHQRGVERRIMASIAPADPFAAMPCQIAEIRAALDSRTALLMLYEGPWVDGRFATYSFLLTAENEYFAVGAVEMPYGMYGASADGREVQMPPNGFYAGAIRRAVKEEPAPRDVSREGEKSLDGLGRHYAKLVYDHLGELTAAGKDRLLIVPHGATHFLPLHLAGPPGRPLADSFTVTYLANIAQLTSGHSARGQASWHSGAAVFALGYADQPRLPRLESSADEARVIADILDVEPVLDAAVTEPAFARALQKFRYVHLRAHGRHNVDAPLFQTVFLAPSHGHDGRLRAHEVLPLDLRGLDVVTLGACETALGRIDRSDNLRGMPAALLLAGAGAVVGTLWEVSAQASTTFFTEFYRLLRSDPHDLAGAFGGAQRHARGRHPEYRDWGAFYLTGGYGKGGNPS